MILQSFLEGFLLGLGAAVPLGPINVLIMSSALRHYGSAVTLGAGAMSADISYLVLILFGLFHFMENPAITLAMGLAGSGFLLYLAWLIFKGRNEPVHLQQVREISLFKSWLKGYTLTLLNPYTVIFWLSVSTYIAAKKLDPIATVAGLFSAIVLWITLMPLAIHKSKHLFSQKIATLFSIASATILTFFAIGMLVKIL
ncbi:LysE family translocator [Nitratifractor salsuginis]|uniref:Lysine exporter protein (LYSE/YGGA) n=1 Tax=Nitratifractor salsuginis (strain DSM 16511 / JCM 12458 / E9I37-1) TaxID=749222 RepID=E6WZ48_NITSE|nr:LysE family transporter [Nitratifractor salsuginis]ADV45498.1 Lysine exporter protein (LYSE/YGGA) [Nitratifractor salsuginis DSM 16511]